LVWLAPDAPVADLPHFDEWDDPTYDCHWNVPRRTPASAFQLTDNFLDATHLPFVHTSTFGVGDAGALPDHRVEGAAWRIWTTYRVLYRNYDDPRVASGHHPLVQPQDLYKEAVAASTALIRLDFPLTGRRLAILFACLPERQGSTRVFKQMARNDFAGDRERLAEAERFEDVVLDEDLAVLERYRTMGIPLDLRDEVHTRSDKLSVAYRRLLRALLAGGEPPAWRTEEGGTEDGNEE
jgi:vanillate O-demethylase monooxygenase subunit